MQTGPMQAPSPTTLDVFADAAIAASTRANSPGFVLSLRAPALEQGDKYHFTRGLHKFQTGLDPGLESQLAQQLANSFPPSVGLRNEKTPERLSDLTSLILTVLFNKRESTHLGKCNSVNTKRWKCITKKPILNRRTRARTAKSASVCRSRTSPSSPPMLSDSAPDV